VYLVGGAVRDTLLGRPVHDRDWVVVGARVDDMLHAGFTPVGSDFPVFLHPETHEEYALARTERKSGHGYKGFTFHADPSVRLEDDLARRDFTINAMAMNAQGQVIDPYGGLRDLETKTLRHVGPAFSEDPLRVLRLARFLARFVDFQVHPDTRQLCHGLQQSGELAYLVPERVWAELNRGLNEAKPSNMMAFLAHINVWPSVLPTVSVPYGQWTDEQFGILNGLQNAEQRWAYVLGCRLALSQINPVCAALRVPNELRDLSVVLAQIRQFIHSGDFSASSYAQLLSDVDIYRKASRTEHALGLFKRIDADHMALQVIEQAVTQQRNGTYKMALRAHLAAVQGGQVLNTPAKQVQQFKNNWVQGLLNLE
jgi:tRNA nucleotidyltransferase (CCA-adding enzyme)